LKGGYWEDGWSSRFWPPKRKDVCKVRNKDKKVRVKTRSALGRDKKKKKPKKKNTTPQKKNPPPTPPKKK